MKASRTKSMRFFKITMIIICMFSVLNTGSAANSITMVFFEDPAVSIEHKWAELVYTEAFSRLNLEFRYKVYPPKRASIMANNGDVDGEPARNENYNKTWQNLIRVEEQVFVDKMLAVAINREIKVETWEQLQGTTYRVEYYRGILLAEKKLKHLVDPEKVSDISSPEQALKKLRANRIDVYIDSETRLRPLLQSRAFKKFGIRIAGELEEIPNYPYLHKRYSDLAPELAKVLRQMKADGSFARYLEQAKQALIQKN